MKHRIAVNFDAIDDYLNDNIDSVSVENGRCVIWEYGDILSYSHVGDPANPPDRKNDCHGDHTGMIVGKELFTNMLCPNYDWAKAGSSIKCCGGNPGAHWCADPGKKVKCTD